MLFQCLPLYLRVDMSKPIASPVPSSGVGNYPEEEKEERSTSDYFQAMDHLFQFFSAKTLITSASPKFLELRASCATIIYALNHFQALNHREREELFKCKKEFEINPSEQAFLKDTPLLPLLERLRKDLLCIEKKEQEPMMVTSCGIILPQCDEIDLLGEWLIFLEKLDSGESSEKKEDEECIFAFSLDPLQEYLPLHFSEKEEEWNLIECKKPACSATQPLDSELSQEITKFVHRFLESYIAGPQAEINNPIYSAGMKFILNFIGQICPSLTSSLLAQKPKSLTPFHKILLLNVVGRVNLFFTNYTDTLIFTHKHHNSFAQMSLEQQEAILIPLLNAKIAFCGGTVLIPSLKNDEEIKKNQMQIWKRLIDQLLDRAALKMPKDDYFFIEALKNTLPELATNLTDIFFSPHFCAMMVQRMLDEDFELPSDDSSSAIGQLISEDDEFGKKLGGMVSHLANKLLYLGVPEGALNKLITAIASVLIGFFKDEIGKGIDAGLHLVLSSSCLHDYVKLFNRFFWNNKDGTESPAFKECFSASKNEKAALQKNVFKGLDNKLWAFAVPKIKEKMPRGTKFLADREYVRLLFNHLTNQFFTLTQYKYIGKMLIYDIIEAYAQTLSETEMAKNPAEITK